MKSMRAQDLSAVWKMCTKCGPKIVACLRDPQCKAALDCLQGCASNDQVCRQQGLSTAWALYNGVFAPCREALHEMPMARWTNCCVLQPVGACRRCEQARVEAKWAPLRQADSAACTPHHLRRLKLLTSVSTGPMTRQCTFAAHASLLQLGSSS